MTAESQASLAHMAIGLTEDVLECLQWLGQMGENIYADMHRGISAWVSLSMGARKIRSRGKDDEQPRPRDPAVPQFSTLVKPEIIINPTEKERESLA